MHPYAGPASVLRKIRYRTDITITAQAHRQARHSLRAWPEHQPDVPESVDEPEQAPA